MFFLIIYRQWAEKNSISLENYRRRCQNCILHVHRNILKKKNSSGKMIFLLSFSDNEQIFSAFCRQTFGGMWRLDFTCPWEHFEEKFFEGLFDFFRFSNLFWIWSGDLSVFFDNFSTRWSKLDSFFFLKEYLFESFFPKTCFLYKFRTLRKKRFGPLVWNFFVGDVGTAF